ncbi:MAG: hypothetical protein H6760_03675 [Candidatus Nomurabacteria bacterium]|nr:MAG: hypothetical protein H6760_03675 [Candidatus Nomurabacteria bacterium]
MSFSISMMVLSESGSYMVPRSFTEAEVEKILANPEEASLVCRQCGQACSPKQAYCPHRGQTHGVVEPHCASHRPEDAYDVLHTLRHALEAWRKTEADKRQKRETERCRAEEERRRSQHRNDLLTVPQLGRLRSRLGRVM